MTAGRPSLLTPELVARAREQAKHGFPVALIADELGIGRSTASRWIQVADEKGPDSLEYKFREAIFLADTEKCKTLLVGLESAASTGNAWAATWLLTHHPRLREHFSDAAADRRAERKTMATVLEAVAAVELPAELEQALLLQMQARGLGTQAPES